MSFGIKDPIGLLRAPKLPTETPNFPRSELIPLAWVNQSSVSEPWAFICHVQPPDKKVHTK